MQFFIREMHPNEKEAVEKLFARSLGIIDRIVFQLSFEDAQKSAKKQKGGTLIAEHGSEIVGTIDRSIDLRKNCFPSKLVFNLFNSILTDS